MDNGNCWCGREYPCLEHGSSVATEPRPAETAAE